MSKVIPINAVQNSFKHCVKSVRIRSYSGPHFLLRISPYSVQIRENADQNNSEYGHFLRSESFHIFSEKDQLHFKTIMHIILAY